MSTQVFQLVVFCITHVSTLSSLEKAFLGKTCFAGRRLGETPALKRPTRGPTFQDEHLQIASSKQDGRKVQDSLAQGVSARAVEQLLIMTACDHMINS